MKINKIQKPISTKMHVLGSKMIHNIKTFVFAFIKTYFSNVNYCKQRHLANSSRKYFKPGFHSYF